MLSKLSALAIDTTRTIGDSIGSMDSIDMLGDVTHIPDR